MYTQIYTDSWNKVMHRSGYKNAPAGIPHEMELNHIPTVIARMAIKTLGILR